MTATEVAIVGGGIAGCATAYYLAERGVACTVVERDGIAAHASGFAYNDIAGVVHGFRSSFRDWAAEHGWERDIAEAALAHTVRNAVEAAYRRTRFLDKRRKMMERWGEHCMAAMPVRPKVKVRVRRKIKVRARRK